MSLFAYRSTPHSTTGFTPFQLHTGRQPRTPFDTLAESIVETKHQTAGPYLKELQQVVKGYKIQARSNLKSAMESRKMYHDQKVNYRSYVKGDLVMCRDYTCKPGLKPKLVRDRWTGPWIVDRVRGPVNFRIKRKGSKGKPLRLLVHHDRLKFFHKRSARLDEDSVVQQNGPVDVDFDPGEGSVPGSTLVEAEVLQRPGDVEESESDESDEESVDESDDDEPQANGDADVQPVPPPPRNRRPNAVNLPRVEGNYVTASGRTVVTPNRLIQQM